MFPPPPTLSDAEHHRYSWQLDIPGHGQEGQRRLKAATVLISRAGGVGGTAALHLAAAGIGRWIWRWAQGARCAIGFKKMAVERGPHLL